MGGLPWDGIGVLVSIAFGVLSLIATVWSAVWSAAKARRREPAADPTAASAPTSAFRRLQVGVLPRLGGAICVWFLACTAYGAVWTVLAFSLGFNVVEGQFLSWWLSLGTFAASGALLIKPTAVGGFVGGGVPLAVLALYWSSEGLFVEPSNAKPFAYFVVFLVFGGMLGLMTGAPAVAAARKLELPLPRG